MKICYLGHACFRLTTENNIKIVTDPYQGVGYELPSNVTADIVTVSHQHFDHNYVEAVEQPFERIQGECEKQCYGVSIKGMKTWHDPEQGRLRGENIVYVLRFDGLSVCHLGDIGEACTQEFCEKLGEVDILLLPIGGTYTIDAKQAKIYIEKIQPKVAVPMHYRPQDGKLDIAGAEIFLSQFPQTQIKRVKGEISLSYEEINSAKEKIIFMERSNEV